MDLTFTQEQDELRKVVRSFLAKYSDEAAVRRLAADPEGHDDHVWRRMAGELGLQGLAVPEQYGGSGFGYVDLGIVFEEAGRALLCGPYFATVALAAEALLRCDDERARQDLLPGIASGEAVATLALTEDSGRWDEPGIRLTAHDTAHGWRLAACEDLRPRRPPRRPAPRRRPYTRRRQPLRGRRRRRAGPHPHPSPPWTRPANRPGWSSRTPRTAARRRGTAWPALERTLATACVLLAAEQVGGATAALDAAVDYAGMRVQYGRPIGSFQGIKHKCADMLTDIESARSAAYGGLWALDAYDDTEIAVAAALAQAFCSEAFTRVAGDNIQVHGGIGFTWEHPAHLYFKRAKSSEVLLGSPSYHRELLATRLGI